MGSKFTVPLERIPWPEEISRWVIAMMLKNKTEKVEMTYREVDEASKNYELVVADKLLPDSGLNEKTGLGKAEVIFSLRKVEKELRKPFWEV